MKKFLVVLLLLGLTSACGALAQPATESPLRSTPQPVQPTPGLLSDLTTLVANTAEVDQVIVVTQSAPADFFSQMSITLSPPVCEEITPSQMEGPYYTADTPERNSLLEDGMQGTRLILVGFVLDQNCQPLADTWLDFWQADTNGDYDNAGYRLRGHQFTDEQGRYYLETILPGLYLSRPIEHIHVKVKPQGGAEVTSQLYFPDQPVDGLTVTLEDRGEYFVGFFNFVIQR